MPKKKKKTENHVELSEFPVEKERRDPNSDTENAEDITNTDENAEDVWSQEEIEAALDRCDYISQKLSEGKYRVILRQKCGHTICVDIRGKMLRTRERKIAALMEKKCWECETAEAMPEAQKTAVLYDLPELKGTEKQIKWATIIRSEKINEFQAAIQGADSEVIEYYVPIFNKILKYKASKFWIENRDYDIDWLLDDYDLNKFKAEIEKLNKKIQELKRELQKVRTERTRLKNQLGKQMH